MKLNKIGLFISTLAMSGSVLAAAGGSVEVGATTASQAIGQADVQLINPLTVGLDDINFGDVVIGETDSADIGLVINTASDDGTTDMVLTSIAYSYTVDLNQACKDDGVFFLNSNQTTVTASALTTDTSSAGITLDLVTSGKTQGKYTCSVTATATYD